MDQLLTQSKRGRLVVLVVGGVLIVGAALFSYTYYVGRPLGLFGARLTGPDRGSVFSPLVAHSRSAAGPCYDEGTQYCEKLGGGAKQTVGFLFYQRPNGIQSDPLYGCTESNNATAQYLLTTTYTECRQKKAKPYQYGFVAKSDNFENSTPLIYCEGSGEVVADASACTGTARQLGYMTAAVQPALAAVCKDLALSGGKNNYCTELTAAAPASASSQWQNRTKPADVNGDGAVTPLDLLSLINAHNSSKMGKLTESYAVPPYLDVNGDGHFSPLDFNSLYTTEDWQKLLNAGAGGERPPVAYPWQNQTNQYDVNNDGSVTPQDVLVLTNEMNRRGTRTLPAPTTGDGPPPYYDVNGDGSFTAQDLNVWNNRPR